MGKVIKLIILLSFFCSNIYAQQHPLNLTLDEKWLCQITFVNHLGPFNTILYFNYLDSVNFNAYSSRNADKRIFGNFKATFGRLLKKSPKKGVFMSITDGEINSSLRNDSLTAIIHIPMIGIRDFKAVKIHDSIFGSILDSNETIGHLIGVKSQLGFQENYKALNQRIFDTLKTYIYNPELLETRKWRRFVKKVDKLADRVLDDVEYFFGFNLLSQKLPFSHLNLFLFSEDPNLVTNSDEKYLFLKEMGEGTAYLDITSFGGSALEIDSIFNIILMNNYRNLIIDLRNNAGGGLNSAISFGSHLCRHKLNAGYFVTNKWYQNHQKNNTLDFSNIQATSSITTSAFVEELKHTAGKQLIISPAEKTYKGHVFILTSGKTASTCEPIVYGLKKNKLATVVGERTAGAMLSATIFQIMDKYYIFLPIADYYTSDGQRLDQIGVEPNMIVNSKDALDFVIENLIK